MTSKKEIKLELAFPYDIKIIPTVNGGCIVNVGCARLSYSTPARMLIDLKKYLADPQGYEKAFYECNKSISAVAEPERPSLTGGQTVEEIPETAPDDTRRDPEDHPGDRERREGETETSEDTEPG